jgi:multidrug transporter EmrE-like cation transporter
MQIKWNNHVVILYGKDKDSQVAQALKHHIEREFHPCDVVAIDNVAYTNAFEGFLSTMAYRFCAKHARWILRVASEKRDKRNQHRIKEQSKTREVVSEKDKKKKTSLKTIIMLILMLLGEGGTMVVQNAFGNLVQDGNTAMYSFLMFAINALVLYICYLVQALFFKKPKMAQTENGETIKEKSKEKALKPLSKTLLICGAFLAFALFMINILVTELTAAVVPALLFSLSSAIAIIVTMLVGRFVYGEKMSVRNVIGIVLCAGSLAMISFL